MTDDAMPAVQQQIDRLRAMTDKERKQALYTNLSIAAGFLITADMPGPAAAVAYVLEDLIPGAVAAYVGPNPEKS